MSNKGDQPMEHHRHAEQNCLSCGTDLNLATNLTGTGGPKPGDCTVCLRCGHLMTFGPGLEMENPTDEVLLEMAGSPALLMATAISGMYRDRQKQEDKDHAPKPH